MQKFPFQRQMDAMDCGPTCLHMIARFYGRILPLDDVREKCAITRGGVTLGGIAEAAELYAFKTVAIKANLRTLQDDVILPCIAHWRQQHFIVVYAIKGGHVYVADPAFGLMKYSVQEFLSGWLDVVNADSDEEGILLLLDTTPEFYRDDECPDARGCGIGFLWPYFRPYYRLIGQLFIGLFAGSLILLAFPFMTQALVDYGVNHNNLNFVYVLLAAQLMLFLSQTSVELIRSWILLHIGSRINIAIISDFLLKLMKLPVAFFDSKMIGDLLQRVQDHHRVEEFLSSATLTTLFSALNLVLFSCVLAWYSLQILAVFAIGTALYAGWVLMFMSRRAVLDYKRFEQAAQTQSSMVQIISGMQEIKLNNSERRRRWEWEKIQVRLFKVSVDSLALYQYQMTGANFINELKNILITFLCAKAVIEGHMTVGMMLSTQYIIGQLNVPISNFVSFVQSFQDAKISLNRLAEVHDKADENKSQHFIQLSGADNTIMLQDNLCFRYGREASPLVLNNINAVFPKGKVTAIVGASGSGKTTLLKILLKFYEPNQGAVRVGGIDLQSLSTTAWRQSCGVVMQNGFIFNDTVLRNITESESDGLIDQNRLQRAIDIANLDELISGLPNGLNTKIGPDGLSLSGGQNQRILIARAVYKDPAFLFFDEATSALDAKNERIILEKMEQFYQGRTVIVIAHRLSTVKNADQILVLDKGRVVESGNHQQLTATRGVYFNLVKNQLELGN
ncbi:peptidase domain-containing ABC transporter [Methylicorpusculum sp.]|uniref:peptidase domain-containing ABC transporter n=1 Tax=Methylicorpusculum sp. TaxID=2713644 RepID=UPI002730168A|nr:peptidase domain-containing ABC transporter [Methylicorpusculum sp.]MDP2178170.1 peptidase domain-containing ABC transporter [Methylicorpusculum sp.]MDP3530485.1 peptidase domain-containing ABC transporter [Methylicorpusculum sp.]MDZ4153129.1 peptidase domain-containing ABC transporter [Methylicorpusculum sp.]